MAGPDPDRIPEWRIQGDWFDLCSCAIGCPCVFSSNPTQGFCDGALSWLIRRGHYGDVPLDGDLGVVAIVHFEGNVLDRNREFGWLIDDRATPAQREALASIFSGRAGGAFAAWADLTVNAMGIEYAPVRIACTPERWTVEVPGRVSGEGGPFRKYMIPPGQVCTITNAPRPEVTPGHITVGQALRNAVTAFGKRWDWASHSSKHIAFDLRGPGAFTWRQPLAAAP
jgi:hypothetical protein